MSGGGAAITTAAFVRRETAISVVINVAISLFFFLLVFGTNAPARLWGVGGLVFDFAPQGFMIGLMATLVPGLLAAKARRAGKVMPGGSPNAAQPLPVRAIAWGLVAAGAGVALSAALAAFSGLAVLAWPIALMIKLGFGALVALVVTPPGLRTALSA